MLKKLLTFTLILVGAFTLVGCGGDDEPTTAEILEQITEAVDNLSIPSSTDADLTLPTTEVHDVTITWESSDTDYIADDGTVTIPLYTDGDQTVTLTAYVELDGETLTKTFTVTVPAATAMTDVDRVIQAKDALVLSAQGVVTDDITLPVTGSNGTTITWSSSDTDVITDAGVVTRPAPGSANAVVTMTATITLNDVSRTKEFEVAVKADVAVDLMTIAALKTAASLDTPTVAKNDEIKVQGEVVSLFTEGTYKGYYISDGTGFLYVHTDTAEPTVEVGDEVELRGVFDLYFGMPQIKDTIITEITTETFTVPAPVVKTVAQILAYGSTGIPLENYSQLIEVTGYVYQGDEYLYLKTDDGMVEINDDSDISLLEDDYMDKKITATFLYHSYHSGHADGNHQISFTGNAADVALAPLTDAESVAADATNVKDVPPVTFEDITLPTTGNNATTYGTWTSSNTALVNNAGEIVGTVSELTEVTFTATVTKNSETTNASVTVVFSPGLTVSEVNDLEVGDYFYLEGATVYQESYYGFYVWDGTEYLFISHRDLQDDLAPGDTIDLTGKLSERYGLRQAIVLTSTIDTATDVAGPDAVAGTVEGIYNNVAPKGQITTITALVTIEGTYDDVVLNGADGAKLTVYYRSNAEELEDYEGQVITIDVYSYEDGLVLYYGTGTAGTDVTVVNDGTTTYTWTDAQIAQALADNFMFDEVVETNLTLPTTDADSNTYAWTSTNSAVATDGTVTPVAGSRTEGTLTVTVTVGSETATQDYFVVVEDANEVEVPMTVTEVLAESYGTDVFVIGVVSGFDADGNALIQDPDGTAIALYHWSNELDAEIGDKVTLRGTFDEYSGSATDDQEVAQLEYWELVEVISTGNTVFVDTTISASVLANNAEDHQAERLVMNLKIKSFDDGHGMIVFYGGTSMDIVMFQELAPFINDVAFDVDDNINVEFNVTRWNHYGNVRIGDPSFTFSSTQKLNVATYQATAMLPEGAAGDIVLPTALAEYGATISWASSNEAVIATDGTVTQPTAGSGDVTVTLTATVTVGSSTDTSSADVLVKEEFLAVGTELFFSEYIEGSNSNKAIEIFNPTSSPIDLSLYTVNLYSNGATSPTNSITLSGTLLPGEVYVIYNSSAWSEISSVGDVSSSVTYYNGDDALELVNDGTIIDVIGVVGVDPGSNWTVGTGSTGEHTLVRKSSVTGPNSTFTAAEWDVYDQNTFDYLGSHDVDAPAS